MSFLADAHRDWHTAHGWDKVCPLDCGVGEAANEEYDREPLTAEEEAEIEECGTHDSVQWTKRTIGRTFRFEQKRPEENSGLFACLVNQPPEIP